MVQTGTSFLLILLFSLLIVILFLYFFQIGQPSHQTHSNHPAHSDSLNFKNNPAKTGFLNLYKQDYIEFTCWLSCPDRATVMCHYKGTVDKGNAKRPTSFKFDPNVSKKCQQNSTKSYNSVKNGFDL